LVGSEPGERKLKKMQDMKKIIIDEDGLFDMIRTLPAQKVDASMKLKSPRKEVKAAVVRPNVSVSPKKPDSSPGKKETHVSPLKHLQMEPTKKYSSSSSFSKLEEDLDKGFKHTSANVPLPTSLLWPDKYRPDVVKEIAGNPAVIGRFTEW
jgi:hypothetical protein